MADCTGYGIGVNVSLCVAGAVGNGNTADLEIFFENVTRSNFDDGESITIADWDGKAFAMAIPSVNLDYYGFNDSSCFEGAQITVTPTSQTQGTVLLEFFFNNCTAGDEVQAFENCGGAGPHTVSVMSSFTLAGVACTA